MGEWVNELRMYFRKEGKIIIIIDPHKGYPYPSNLGVDTGLIFTSPEGGEKATKYVLGNGVDAVVGTTKFYLDSDGSINEKLMGEFRDLAEENQCRMLLSPNYSIGMFHFVKIVKDAAKRLNRHDYDIGIVELHHRKKVDVSGSGIKIASALSEICGKRVNYGDVDGGIREDEINLSSVRVGHIPGKHQVILDGKYDTITLTHEVRDPKVFALGAVEAAYLLREKPPGVYTLEHLM